MLILAKLICLYIKFFANISVFRRQGQIYNDCFKIYTTSKTEEMKYIEMFSYITESYRVEKKIRKSTVSLFFQFPTRYIKPCSCQCGLCILDSSIAMTDVE